MAIRAIYFAGTHVYIRFIVRHFLMLALWWIKRDIRLEDNLALTAAINECRTVLPVFFFEPVVYLARDASAFHLQAQISALTDLQHSLRQRGVELLVMQADLPCGLQKLHREFAFTHIFSHEETGAAVTYERDIAVGEWCKESGIVWRELPQSSVVRALGKRTDRQKIIASRLLDSEPLPIPEFVAQSPALFSVIPKHYLQIPSVAQLAPQLMHRHIQWPAVQVVSEKRAQRALNSFFNERSLGYRGGISSPNKAFFYGSRLSPHIAWGTVSLRNIFARLQRRIDQLDVSINAPHEPSQAARWHKSLVSFSARLFWRDHFIQRLESASYMEFSALNPAYDVLEYSPEGDRLQVWLQGMTGFPLVDACMRCLQATGFLNFRMRAMVVNFACFGLHIHWRDLQYPLAQLFVDYEPGIHFSQVQMQAAIVGINTLRIYNPLKQLIEQDPQCIFVKRWIPELRAFTPEQIACHPSMPLPGYPAPIVDADQHIRVMKERITAIRRSDEGQKNAAEVLRLHGSRLRRKQRRDSKARIQNNGKVAEALNQLNLF